MKFFTAFLLPFCFSGCATLQVSQVLPDYSGIDSVAASQRADTYRQLGVIEVRDNLVRIADRWYNSDQFKEICSEVGDTQAARIVGKYGRMRPLESILTFGIPVAWGSIIGVLLWGGDSLIKTLDTGAYAHNQTVDGDSSLVYKCALAGLGIGIIATSIDNFYIQPRRRNYALRKAREIFNQNLWLRLNSPHAPASQTPSAGVERGGG